MIVRHFLRFIQTASAGERAEAVSALARAYLHSDMTGDFREAAEAAMMMLLDDPSPVVRRALAEGLASSEDSPVAVVVALLQDQSEIAALIARHSPHLFDAELVDLVGGGDPLIQFAIAERDDVPVSVAAAIAEVGCLEACQTLLLRHDVTVAGFSLARIVDRHGHDALVRDSLFARDDLPSGLRQQLVAKLSEELANFVSDRAWLDRDRAQKITRDATEKATVTIAATEQGEGSRALVHHLRVTGQLTTGIILRALLSGHMRFFEDALGELAEITSARASGLVQDRSGHGFRALYDKAGMPQSAFPAFKAALDAWRSADSQGRGSDGRLHRAMVERVLTAYSAFAPSDLDQLLSMLRRFAAEAARDEARLFARDLIAGQTAVEDENLPYPAAA